ncbi:MAG TPA: DUF1569 domain-containing protein [Candidatus Eisenbacteria bacterium]|jgi:hypothetical protein
MKPAVDGEHFDALMEALDGAAAELIAAFERDAARWTKGRPGKWTAGQHTAHVAITLAVTADAFEERLPQVLAGTLGPPPRRGPLQWLWVSLVVGRATLPRGLRTPRRFEPGQGPERAATLERVRRELERHRAVGRPLTPAQRDRLWIRSPFVSRWHYRLPEIIRVQAVHVRHHLRQIEEIP